MNNLFEAIRMAMACHGLQKDKAGKLYILHPLRVMANFYTEDDSYQIAAVLHDTVEDTSLTLELIKYHFGQEITDIVDALSRREEETYTQFIKRCVQNKKARAIKLADIKDNLNPERGDFPTLRDKYAHAYDLIIDTVIQENDPTEIEFLVRKELFQKAG